MQYIMCYMTIITDKREPASMLASSRLDAATDWPNKSTCFLVSINFAKRFSYQKMNTRTELQKYAVPDIFIIFV